MAKRRNIKGTKTSPKHEAKATPKPKKITAKKRQEVLDKLIDDAIANEENPLIRLLNLSRYKDNADSQYSESFSGKDELRNEITTRFEHDNTITENLNTEVTQRTEAVGDINDKIPAAASSTNQLVDNDTLNQKLVDAGANLITDNGYPFKDPSALPTTGIEKNDYAYVTEAGTSGGYIFHRYKYSGTEWQLEFTLANEFTIDQWRNINATPGQYMFVDEDGTATYHNFLEVTI